MTLEEILSSRLFEIGGLIVILGLIQISPLQLNPWTWIKKFISMPSKLDKLEGELEESRIIQARIRIIMFACDIRRGEKFDEDSYAMIMDDIHTYTSYCAGHPDFENGRCRLAVKLIERTYHTTSMEEGFLA